MINWIDTYKRLAYSSHQLVTIAIDPDRLMDYPELREALKADGYQVWQAESALEARCLFELHMRGNVHNSILAAPKGYQPLPDITSEVHRVEIGFKQLFPMLAGSALKGITPAVLDKLSSIPLYEEQSHNQTLQFILEHYYHVDIHQGRTRHSRERLLSLLVAVLLSREPPHPPLLAYLEDLTYEVFEDLTAKELSAQRLLQFLQGKWTGYVHSAGGWIDFKEPSLLKTVNFLFITGALSPQKVTRDKYETFARELRPGVYFDEKEAMREELSALLTHMEEQYKVIQDQPEAWFELAPVASKAMLKALALEEPSMVDAVKATMLKINERFQQFLDRSYSGLFSRSGVRHPVTVTRILDYLKAQPMPRKALIVLDGMNFWQWELLTGAFRDAGMLVDTSATLAYIPSITLLSRQAIFRGGLPDWNTKNEREAALFKSYWQAQQVAPHKIAFERWGIHANFSVENLSSSITHLALVCTDLDEILHGNTIGNAQLRSSTLHWIENSRVLDLMRDLKDQDFTCFITSDHGNIEATGIGNLRQAEKVGAFSRSKRHLHFSNPVLRQNFTEQNPSLPFGIEGTSVYLKNAEAFTEKGTEVITHGGSHFWEVVIPLAQI